MLDVIGIGIRERMHHVESQDTAIKASCPNQIETRGSAVTQALRDVASVGKTAVQKRAAPWVSDLIAKAVFFCSSLVRLDFPVVAARFDEMDGMGDTPSLRRNDLETESIFSFLQIFVSVADFLIGGDANAIMVIMRLVGGAGVFVQNERPIRIRVLHDHVSIMVRHDLERQQFLKNRHRLLERAALIMAVYQSDGLNHGDPQIGLRLRNARESRQPKPHRACTFLSKLISSKSSGVNVLAIFSDSR